MIYKFLLGLDFSLMSVIMWRPPVFFLSVLQFGSHFLKGICNIFLPLKDICKYQFSHICLCLHTLMAVQFKPLAGQRLLFKREFLVRRKIPHCSLVNNSFGRFSRAFLGRTWCSLFPTEIFTKVTWARTAHANPFHGATWGLAAPPPAPSAPIAPLEASEFGPYSSECFRRFIVGLAPGGAIKPSGPVSFPYSMTPWRLHNTTAI